MSPKIENKVALVTGALGGIGREIVKSLLKNKAKGIALLDLDRGEAINFENEIQKTFGPGKTLFIETDVRSKEQMKDAYEKTVKHFGQLDIVVNNAGVASENYELTLGVNLMGLMHSTYMAFETYLPKYRSGKESFIINTGSIVGLTPIPKLPAYSVSKYAVLAMSMCYGKKSYFEKHGVTLLTICPGFTKSAMADNIDLSDVPHLAKFGEESLQSPEFVANAVIHAIINGENGSVWLTHMSKPAEEIKLDQVLGDLRQKTGLLL